jgi:hypothetical protein
MNNAATKLLTFVNQFHDHTIVQRLDTYRHDG